MDFKSLKKLIKKDLLEIARKKGLKNVSSLKKDDLIKKILEVVSVKSGSKKKGQKKGTVSSSSKKKTFLRKTAARTVKRKTSELPSDIVVEITEEPVRVGGNDDDISPRKVKSRKGGKEKSLPEKYSYSETPDGYELPYSYNVTKLVAMVRDPYWAYCYWDLDSDMEREVKRKLKIEGIWRPIIRIYDVTGIKFDGENCNNIVDVDITLDAGSWYLYLGEPGRSFIFDIGLIDIDGNFFLIARSNLINIPLDGPSEIIDEKWMAVDFEKIYVASGGYLVGHSSAELGRRVMRFWHEGWLSSGALSSESFQMRGREREEDDFFLEAATEFILYGKTKPDAFLTVEGERVPLRPDGTFSIRYSLPDSIREIPIAAVSSNGKHKRKITIKIKKTTR